MWAVPIAETAGKLLSPTLALHRVSPFGLHVVCKAQTAALPGVCYAIVHVTIPAVQVIDECRVPEGSGEREVVGLSMRYTSGTGSFLGIKSFL